MKYSDKTLSAFIDNELPPEEMAAIKLAMKTDAALASRIAQLKATGALIAETYAEIDNEPMPAAITEMLSTPVSPTPENLLRFAAKPSARPAAPWRVALAASLALAIGIGIGVLISGERTAPRGAIKIASVISPGDAFYEALEALPSGESAEFEDGAIKPILTFRSVDNQFCREFSVINDDRYDRAVACRSNAGWEMRFAAFHVPNNDGSGEYATAASIDDEDFATLVSKLMVDDALASDEEKAVLGRWK